MAVSHVNITDPNIHETKGIAAASDAMVLVANGAGSGTWRYRPHSSFYYTNIGTGVTITGPTSYTKIAPATTGDAAPRLFTHSGTGRLTYTGTPSADVNINITMTIKHSTGAGIDCYFAVHKNGTLQPRMEVVRTANSGTYASVSICGHLEALATNDYLEVFCKCSAGNIVVHTLNVTVMGLL